MSDAKAARLHLLKVAMELTTSHGLPRMVTPKPRYVHFAWLLVFLLMLALFIKGTADFVVKLQTNPVTTSMDVKEVSFEFPDVYACFENPMSGTYPNILDNQTADQINRKLNATARVISQYVVRRNYTGDKAKEMNLLFSFLQPQSLPYSLMVDALGHRIEQSRIKSGIIYKNNGQPTYMNLDPESFYHPIYLRCFKWSLNSTVKDRIIKSSISSGLMLTLLVDTNSSLFTFSGAAVQQAVYVSRFPLPLSEWSLNLNDYFGQERSAGVRIFLTPPGEYPTDFDTNFFVGPGRRYKVDIDMRQLSYKEGQFDCVSDSPDVQFVNPYDQTPYNHSYSYSYCFYYEYHKQFNAIFNLSGDAFPIPWPLRGRNYVLNLSSEVNIMSARADPVGDFSAAEQAAEKAQATCESKRPCKTVEYSVSMSSADWPTESAVYLSIDTLKNLALSAASKKVIVPALDIFLNDSIIDTSYMNLYLRNNLLNIQLKHLRTQCDRVTFSKDYTISTFVSDLGGIMGIYLGMSLLTMCEILELIYDMISVSCGWNKAEMQPKKVTPEKMEITEFTS